MKGRVIFLEAAARGFGGERDVEHDHASRSELGFGSFRGVAKESSARIILGWYRLRPPQGGRPVPALLPRVTHDAARMTGSFSEKPVDLQGAHELIPCVAQDCVTGEIRMLAYATAEAVRLTLDTGRPRSSAARAESSG